MSRQVFSVDLGGHLFPFEQPHYGAWRGWGQSGEKNKTATGSRAQDFEMRGEGTDLNPALRINFLDSSPQSFISCLLFQLLCPLTGH